MNHPAFCYGDEDIPRLRALILGLGLVGMALSWACGAGFIGSEGTGHVEGLVVEIVDRGVGGFETLRVRDANGLVWSFTTEEHMSENSPGQDYTGFTASHIRQHQLFGGRVVVVYRTEKNAEGYWLVALDVTDPLD